MWWQKLQTGICKWPHLLAASGRRRGCRHCPTKPKSLLEHTANRIEVILLVFFGVRTETCFWFCCNSCCWIARDLIAQATHQSEWFFLNLLLNVSKSTTNLHLTHIGGRDIEYIWRKVQWIVWTCSKSGDQFVDARIDGCFLRFEQILNAVRNTKIHFWCH